MSRSPLLKRALQSVAEAGPGFKPVSYNALRGSMLEKVRYGHSFTAEPCFGIFLGLHSKWKVVNKTFYICAILGV